MKTNTINSNLLAKFIQEGLDNLEAISANEVYGCDLHNRLYNENYFIIGTWEAKEFLKEYDVFKAIEKVTEYEKDNFGEVTTDISDPEKLVNMLAYIHGEEILSNCKALQANWDDYLSEGAIEGIKEELTEQF